jgi:Coenzyme PQQ synthesis protein D (PqqD)
MRGTHTVRRDSSTSFDYERTERILPETAERPERSEIDLLSGSAGMIWQALDAPKTKEDVARALAELYRIDFRSIAHDVYAFVDDLAERGWVEKFADAAG